MRLGRIKVQLTLPTSLQATQALRQIAEVNADLAKIRGFALRRVTRRLRSHPEGR